MYVSKPNYIRCEKIHKISNFSKKPTVFLFNDGDSLTEAEGYAADMAKLLQVALNFSAVLVPNTGFGAYRNGTWNGMVGDLYRGVSRPHKKKAHAHLHIPYYQKENV